MKRGLRWVAAPRLALALAGCGGSGSDGSAEQTAAGSAPQTPQVIVETAAPGFNAARVYREASPGVVTIRSIFGDGGGAAEGSGFVLDASGRIVTNAHVVTDESSGARKPAKEVFVEFSDRNVVAAQIVGFDPFADVALLKVKPDGFALHPLKLGDDRKLEVGQPVAAIGSPFGEQQSLSVGVVSATDRSVESLTKFQIEGAIQTDASINPGNSGGPLLDAGARVVGINQQIETESGANDGVGFAVPISAIKRSLAQLERDGEAEYAYIGVSTQPLYPQLAQQAQPRHRPRRPDLRSRRRQPRRRSGPGGRRRQAALPGRRLPHRGRRDPRRRRPRGDRPQRPRRLRLRLQARRNGHARRPPQRQAKSTSKSRWASARAAERRPTARGL